MGFNFNIRIIKMIKNILKLSTAILMLLFVSNSYVSATANDGKITVDEAQSQIPNPDTIKGGDDIKDKYIDRNVSLSSIEKFYVIERENLLFPPYRCFIYHPKGNETDIGIIDNVTINFSIDKSRLNIGDIILVTNEQEVKSNNPIKQFIIEEVTIIK